MTTAPRGYFPGSRTPLPHDSEKPKSSPVEPTAWDSRPIMKMVGGEPTEFFLIGALCTALGRPPVTIRMWINDGHLPDAKYRMPDKNNIRGRRLYTRAQIESVLEVAERHGILGSDRINWSHHGTFADEIRRAWADH